MRYYTLYSTRGPTCRCGKIHLRPPRPRDTDTTQTTLAVHHAVARPRRAYQAWPRKLAVESAPEARSPAQVVLTTEEPLGPYRARLENLSSHRQSYRARARKEHEGAVQAAIAVQAQQASQLQADEDLFDEEESLTSMAALNFHKMPFGRITGLQDAIKRNCNCANQVRRARGVSEIAEELNRRCLAALQAWMHIYGSPWGATAHLR